MNCPKCNSPLNEGDKFCQVCGSVVENAAPQPMAQPAPMPGPMPMGAVPGGPAKKNNTIVIVLGAVIAVLAIIVVVLFVSGGKDDEKGGNDTGIQIQVHQKQQVIKTKMMMVERKKNHQK